MAKLTLCVFSCTFLSLCLSFKAELALFVAIFQFVGTEGRPFMFGRMTTDLGDKSRFPPFLYLQVRRVRIGVPDHSNIAPISRFLGKSLWKLNWHIRRNAFGTNARKSFGQTHSRFRNGVALSKGLKFAGFCSLWFPNSRRIWGIVHYSGLANKWVCQIS